MIEHKNKIGLIQIIAALLIVNHHTSILKIPYLHHLTKSGFVFNTIFVYLSGYLLAKSYNSNITINYYNFLRRRFLRIYPSLHISLLFIIIIGFFIGRNFSFSSVLLSLSGFQYFFGITSFGPQMWFISIILVCYILCIPTIFIIRNKPFYLYMILFIILIILLLKDDSYNNFYNKVNNIPLYRFFYHYIIFSLGLHLSLLGKDVEIFNSWPALIIFFITLLIYFLLISISYLGLIRILVSIIMAFSIVTLISESYIYFIRTIPDIFKLSSITYEIYLIHIVVIYFFEYIAPGKFYTYPLVFIISIALASIISKLSKYYTTYIDIFATNRNY
jgi:peptidoglycan/LPS O-acetylase OafA/YrhL